MTKMMKWGMSACVAVLALALNVSGASAQQKAPEAPKDAAKTATPPKAPAAKTPAPAAKKVVAPACNTVKDQAGCEARKDECDWVAEATITKGARKGQKQAAYCRKLPAKKPAAAPKAPAAAKAPAAPAAKAPAPAPKAPAPAPAAPAPAPAPKN